MNFELPSLEERARVISRENRRASVIINGITSTKSISDITTTILYKLPLHYQKMDCVKAIIKSLAIDKEYAQTTVYGLPIDADRSVIFHEFSETYELGKISRRHGQITQKLEILHLQSPGVIYASKFHYQ